MAAPQIPGWQQLVLQGVGAPTTPQNIQYLNAWTQAEGGGAANNPFNTTQPVQGATGYNSVGVRNYQNPQQGIQATIQTLKNGHYQNILDSLHRGNSAMATAQALAASPWGTGALVEKVLGGPVSTTAQAPVNPSTARAATMAGLGSSAIPGADGQRTALLSYLQGQLANYGATGHATNPNGFTGLLQSLTPGGQMPYPGSTPNQDVPQVPGTGVAGVNADGQGAKIAKTALTQIGIPYQWGGAAKLGNHTDCSGLLQESAAAAGINLPRTTYDQFKHGTPVPTNQLQAGDAVFFEPGPNGPNHVGIYIGNGNFIEDPHTGSSVRVEKLSTRTGYVGARRYT